MNFSKFCELFPKFDKLFMKIDELFQIEELFFENDVSLFFLKSPYGQLWIDQMFNGQLNWTINLSVESNQRAARFLFVERSKNDRRKGVDLAKWGGPSELGRERQHAKAAHKAPTRRTHAAASNGMGYLFFSLGWINGRSPSAKSEGEAIKRVGEGSERSSSPAVVTAKTHACKTRLWWVP